MWGDFSDVTKSKGMPFGRIRKHITYSEHFLPVHWSLTLRRLNSTLENSRGLTAELYLGKYFFSTGILANYFGKNISK